MSSVEYHDAPRDPNILGNVLNDLFIAVVGYTSAHLLCCDYIYKHR